MPRYHFDIQDQDKHQRDEEGSELLDLEEVRHKAQSILPDIAREELVKMGADHRTYTVLVRDEGGQPVYSATLSYAGLWLQKESAQVTEPGLSLSVQSGESVT